MLRTRTGNGSIVHYFHIRFRCAMLVSAVMVLGLASYVQPGMSGYTVSVSDTSLEPDDFGPSQAGKLEHITSAQLDSIITAAMETYHIPGVSAMVVKDTQVIWAQTYGYADVENSVPVADSTVFMVASISKTFIANAALQLWENGLLDLDADVSALVPFSVANPLFPGTPITMRMLLTHTSSIAREDSIMSNRLHPDGDSPYLLADFLEDYLDPSGDLYDSGNYIAYEPGTYYKYSNFGFGLAGYVIEQVAGITLEQYCQDSLFAPLGMNETSWHLSGLDTANVAVPYRPSGDSVVRMPHYGILSYPCGSLRTSAPQLARHLMAFMNQGALDGQRILDSATVDSIRTTQFAGPGRPTGRWPGFGWFGYYFEWGDARWGHGGRLWGGRSAMYYDSISSTGYVLLENGDTAVGHNEMHDALRIFSADRDLDGIIAGYDNCPEIYNPGQEDANANGVGDACDCSESRFVSEGEAAGDFHGWSVGHAGDVDGDGYDDYIAGARYNDEGGNNAGRAYVYSGLSGLALMVLTGEAAGDNFGVSVSGAGDVNNDGLDDVIVGAYANDHIGNAAGRAYVFHSSDGPYPRYLKAADADLICDGEAEGDNFGWQVGSIPDLDGDSCSEVIVSAIQSTSGLTGKVYVFSGNTGTRLYTITGEANDDIFGYHVAGAGDVNQDGDPDIIVGARGNDANGVDAGRAYVFYGGPGPYPIDRAAASADMSFDGAEAGARMGGSVAGAGDVNNDGFDDVIIGVTHAHHGAFKLAGAAYVMSGFDGDTLHVIYGEGRENYLGWAVCGMGDIDGDGFDDVAVGAPSARPTPDLRPGRVYVFSGQEGDLLHVFVGDIDSSGFGRHIAGGFDADGDGTNDLVIAARKSALEAGQVYLYPLGDADGDELYGGCDNCGDQANPGQDDFDGDGAGDVCDVCPKFPVLWFRTGDANMDPQMAINSSDIIYLVNYVFKSGPEPLPIPESGDVNDDAGGAINSADIIYLVNFVFKSGPEPLDACEL